MQETSSLHSGVKLRAYSYLDPIEEFKLEAGDISTFHTLPLFNRVIAPCDSLTTASSYYPDTVLG